MAFAIVQQTLETIAREQARAAWQTAGLTAFDGLTAVKDAYGILAERLSAEQAAALQAALAAQNVATEVVDEDDLPALPPVRALKRADCLPEGLTVYDAVGRASQIAWSKVMVIAAGSVGFTKSKLDPYDRPASNVGAFGTFLRAATPPIHLPPNERYVEVSGAEMLLELVVPVAPGRYQVDSRSFNYAYLGDRRGRAAASNFILLVRDLMQLAPQAGANRGAVGLTQEPPLTFPYPTRHAFEEETIWLLWQFKKQRP